MKLGVKNELCSGCRTCELACALANFAENNPKKAALRICGEFPSPGRYRVIACDQCGQCAEACPVGCIVKEGDGYRLVPDECSNCLVCVEACPRGAMFTHPGCDTPIKCGLCGTCIEMCPRGALFDEGGAGA